MRRRPTPKLAFLFAAAGLTFLAACRAEFPEGSPYNGTEGRALLQERVDQDVSAMVQGMQQAQELRFWSSRLRRGD